MNVKQYRTQKGTKNVTAFYSKDFNWKVIVPTMVYNYLKEQVENIPPFKEFKLDIALYYLSLIMGIPATHKDKIYKWGFVNLDSRLLQKKYYRYNKYFDYFLKINLLESKEYSTNAHRSKSYRYNFSTINSDGKEYLDFDVFEIVDKKFNEKILNENTCNDSFVSCEHLCKWFNDKFQLDFNGLIKNLQLKFSFNKYDLNYERVNPIISKAYNYWYSALTLRDQCFRATRKPDSDNRLHTNLTNMPSIFRPFITYDYENIVSLDISNSQPYFMVLLIEKYNDKRISEIIRKLYGDRIGIMLEVLENITNSKEFQQEFYEVKNSILTGQFYEYLGGVFEHINPFDITYDIMGKKVEWYKGYFYNSDIQKHETLKFKGKRELMKKLTLQILYTPLIRPSKEYQFFKQKFPLLCEIIEVFKTQFPDKGSYKQFPKLLQHIEADCILNFVSKQLSIRYPKMPLWTIHDSICTTVKYFNRMKKTAQELFLSYSEGVIPNFKIECWTQENDCLKTA